MFKRAEEVIEWFQYFSHKSRIALPYLSSTIGTKFSAQLTHCKNARPLSKRIFQVALGFVEPFSIILTALGKHAWNNSASSFYEQFISTWADLFLAQKFIVPVGCWEQ